MRLRLAYLLDMLYTPAELAQEVGFSARQFYRVYVSLGCPCIRDDRRRLWINGKKLASWYKEKYL